MVLTISIASIMDIAWVIHSYTSTQGVHHNAFAQSPIYGCLRMTWMVVVNFGYGFTHLHLLKHIHPFKRHKPLYPKVSIVCLGKIKKRLTWALDITITDQRDQLAVFELSGASSTSLMQIILKPVEEATHVCKDSSPTAKAAQVWRDLRCLRSSSSLPSGVVIGLTVQDPRLE